MIELYTYGTANGQRASVMLELCGLPYRARKVDLRAGEQRTAEFLAINPDGAVPVIVDPTGRTGGRSRSASPAPSSSTWPRRPAASCPRARRPASRRSSGSSR
jgi:hypothetical protein